jgi:hypothetical protein
VVASGTKHDHEEEKWRDLSGTITKRIDVNIDQLDKVVSDFSKPALG